MSEDTAQLFESIMKLSDRLLEVELQLSVALIQLTEHVHPVPGTGSAVLLREQQQLEDVPEPPPDYQDGLD
jgi:hypothetical protein